MFWGMFESCWFSCWYLKNLKNSSPSNFHQFGWVRESCKVTGIVIFGHFQIEVYTGPCFAASNWWITRVLCCLITLEQVFSTLQHILSNPPILVQPTIIVSDSLAALTAIANANSDHPLVSRIHLLLNTCAKSNSPTSFVWVPSHVRILGNERVDEAAKAVFWLQRIKPLLLPTKMSSPSS